MSRWRWVSFSVLVALCGAAPAEARPFRVGQVPNGATASCLTCHIYPGGPRNAFGATIEHYGDVGFLVNGNVEWGTLAVADPATPGAPPKTLAELDSDGDGRTNGEELLDPSGSWRIGQASPGRSQLVRSPAIARDAPVVIRQVYVSGGNDGAVYRHDFVELFNRSSTAVSLAGWSIQYAPASGPQVFGSSATTLTELPNVSLLPGQSYLVREEGTGSGGVEVPGADLLDPSPIALATTGGKVALVRQAVSLPCNGFPSVCSETQLALVVDWVGYGTALSYEGVGPAPAPSTSQALMRAGGGCIDIDSNGGDPARNPPVLADFSVGTPNPRGLASPRTPCDGSVPSSGAVAAPSLGALQAALLAVFLGLLGRRRLRRSAQL